MDGVNFNDYDVEIEIYDLVCANWIHADYLEEDPNNIAYINNRDMIQPKLVAGEMVHIDPTTNTISISFDDMSQFISSDEGNEIKQGSDSKLFVEFGGLMQDCGSVPTRHSLPGTEDNFRAYYVEDEGLYVFAYNDNRILKWLPLSFFVDMDLYVSQEAFSEYSREVNERLTNFYTKAEADERFVAKTEELLTSALSTIETPEAFTLDDIHRQIVDTCYPIGGSQRYIQYPNALTPKEHFGYGEWEIDTTFAGKTLVGSGTGYEFGSTGAAVGSAPATSVVNQIGNTTDGAVVINSFVVVNYWKRIG